MKGAIKMANKVTKNFKVEGAKIIFKNFSGKESDYNDAGNRNFGVLISDDDASMLVEDGWNVKYLREDETGHRQAWLPVKVKYGDYPPIIYIVYETVNGPRKHKLDEDTINQLDWSIIESADIIIRPYNYPERKGRPAGVSAYVKSMYCNILRDDLESKYESIPEYDRDVDIEDD
jgi:hypothetical protein